MGQSGGSKKKKAASFAKVNVKKMGHMLVWGSIKIPFVFKTMGQPSGWWGG